MKRKINAWEYAPQILQGVEKGILLTTKAGDKVNSMTIGWGTLGVQWGKPIFIAFVRESRFTKQMLEESGEFTINVPLTGCDKNILSVCGTKSGRDMDKIRELGLTLEDPEVISAPAIKELPLTLECKVIYKQDQDPDAINEENTTRYYPKNAQFPQGDYHTAYYGQIVAAYIVE
jgi:flavin reductase (DIM6/NTAB) family NADH-FMN oxidoreductase RutF